MLKPNQMIEVSWCPAVKRHYVDLGYEFTHMQDSFMVKADDLPNGSHKRVVVICEYCGKEFETQFCQHIKSESTGKECCNSCRPKKFKDACLEKYGVANVFAVKSVKEKIKQSCLEKYGVENAAQAECTKEKMKSTSLNKYGYENPSSSKEIRDKVVTNNMKKYGVPNPSKLKRVREKIKHTNIKRYGTTSTVHNPVIAEKVKATNMERYGVPYTTQSPDIIAKMRKSLYNNGNVPTSKAEKQICFMLKDIYGESNCVENYAFDRLNFDCLVNVNDCQIDVEYDGWYWHKNRQEYDKRRNYYVTKRGYKVLRIKSNYELPTREQLIKAIDYLVKGDHSLVEIKLDI